MVYILGMDIKSRGSTILLIVIYKFEQLKKVQSKWAFSNVILSDKLKWLEHIKTCLKEQNIQQQKH